MSESGSSRSVTAVLSEKDDLYYLSPIVLQVEDHLFKVPQYHFARNSAIFRDMFSITQPSEGSQDGSSDKTPLKLEGIQKDEFRRLLEVIYPLEIPPAPNMPKEGWIAVLKLATMWEIDNIRSTAIIKLTSSSMNAIERVQLAKEFHVPQWLRSGYGELVIRSDPPSHEDAEKIGWRSAMNLYQVREEARARGYTSSHYATHILSIIERIFSVELAESQAIYNTYLSYPPPAPPV